MTNKSVTGILLFFLLISIFSPSFSQTGSVSPYSRYGIGEIAPEGFTFQSGMSGLGAAWLSSANINFLNPASYAADTITIFEFGARGELRKIEGKTASTNVNSASFSHFSLGFPILKNRLGAAFGLLPYSSVGYNLSNTVSNIPDIGEITYKYDGEGGFNKVFLGTGLKILPGLFAGINASYLFGTIENSKRIEFPDGANFFNSVYTKGVTARGFYFDYGVLYEKQLKNNLRMTAGVTAALSGSVNAVNNNYYYNYTVTNTVVEGVINVKDSIFNESRKKGNIILPDYWKAGFTIGKPAKWTAGLDFSFQNWEDFKNFDAGEKLKNSWSVVAGGEYKTNRFVFRGGARYGKTFLDLRETQLDDKSISIGIGLQRLTPKRPPSSINIAIELGQKGTIENNLIREQYIRFHLGFTLTDIWFIKPQYD